MSNAIHVWGSVLQTKHRVQVMGPVSVWPTIDTETISCVDIVNANRRISVHALSTAVDISVGSIYMMKHRELGFRKVCAECVFRHLRKEQKDCRMGICLGHFIRAFLERIGAMDESGCIIFLATKGISQQWRQPSSPRPKKAQSSTVAGNATLSLFFDIQEPLTLEWMFVEATINAIVTCCRTFEGRLKASLKGNNQANRYEDAILLQDNTRPHTAKVK
ncbi:hypothetical protein AVEN_97161-1 [Araneus ventricosus]|uniref:Tc1-like transposase DDE domain-containing protein n=1 Tax=Araneus ventricosus TaxID=182803 RepID=A0A4Y2DD97_ARAVE|nr:hypothetical protein AVEN_97161-1 [Araneus ventricosus]